MESNCASPCGGPVSSNETSCPIQDASQPSSESQGASLGDEVNSTCGLTEGENILMTGEALEAACMEIVAIGYTRDQALVAMAASCNNPNRAVEYLMSGGVGVIPEARKDSATESREKFSFPVTYSTEDSSSEIGDDPLTIFASQPQFSHIRQALRSNPQMLNAFLQQVRRTNPPLHKVICENRERFLQTLNEPIAADVGGGVLGEEGGGGGGVAAVSGSILLSHMEHQAVERLMALGFSQSLCVQAYFACEKDENLAGDFLLSQDLDELN